MSTISLLPAVQAHQDTLTSLCFSASETSIFESNENITSLEFRVTYNTSSYQDDAITPDPEYSPDICTAFANPKPARLSRVGSAAKGVAVMFLLNGGGFCGSTVFSGSTIV